MAIAMPIPIPAAEQKDFKLINILEIDHLLVVLEIGGKQDSLVKVIFVRRVIKPNGWYLLGWKDDCNPAASFIAAVDSMLDAGSANPLF